VGKRRARAGFALIKACRDSVRGKMMGFAALNPTHIQFVDTVSRAIIHK
jgi:hypothetical protein